MAEALQVCPKCGRSSPFGLPTCPQCATPLELDATTVDLDETQPLDFGGKKPDPDETQDLNSTVAGQTHWSDPTQPRDATYDSVVPGSTLGGRYEILRQLGEGGMGAVFEARDREVDRIVALKLIRPELAGNSTILQMFKQELVLARQVTHTNVIRIYDLGLVNNLRFITMQFVRGKDLKSLVTEKGKLSPEEATGIIVQVLQGLEAAHKEKVVHRDLKPQNIMIDPQGNALVMDFGLAHSTETGGSEGTLLGTPQYMSPEQANREQIDARSDLFAIGLIFYELLTGVLPFESGSLKESLRRRIKETARPAIEVNPAIPKSLNAIVMKCLEPKREDRYQSAAEVIYDLQVWQGVIVPPAKTWKRTVAEIAVLILLAGIFIGTWLMRRPTTAPKQVALLVADFKNQTGEPLLDHTLELPFSAAMEGASFVSSYNRSAALQLAARMQPGVTGLDENLARLVARREGLGVVISGAIAKRGTEYSVSTKAVDAVTGNEVAKSEVTAANKEKLLGAMAELAQPIRKALGDRSTSSSKVEAGETFTAASLEAAQNYSLGQDALLATKYDLAIQYYEKAIALDPNMGRAYSGLGVIYRNRGDLVKAEENLKIALSKMAQMSQRERYRTRGVYYVTIQSYEKAADEFNTLLEQFPADNVGHANLAICYLYLRNLPRAVEEGRKAIAIYPKNAVQRNNLASYLLYAGRFDEAAKEADEVLKVNDRFERAFVVKALAALASGKLDEAAGFYEQAGKVGARYRTIGLADLALYEGRAADSAALLKAGIKQDLDSGNKEWAAEKQVALAQALLQQGKAAAAATAASDALEAAKDVGIRFLAARALVEAGQEGKARAVAKSLSNQLYSEAQAYGKLIDGELALKKGEVRDAIQLMVEARKLRDTWISRYDLGRAYLAGEAYTEADSEFDACLRRRGEATSLVVDLLPTYAVFPAVHYYLGRAQQGIGNPAAASFNNFLAIKAKSDRDPMVADAKKRAIQ